MTVKSIVDNGVTRPVNILSATQTSTNDPVVVSGSEIDMRIWRSLSYTMSVATNDIIFYVFGANLEDYSDEIQVDTDTISAAGVDSYFTSTPVYAFYRVKIESAVDDNHGAVTLNGLGK